MRPILMLAVSFTARRQLHRRITVTISSMNPRGELRSNAKQWERSLGTLFKGTFNCYGGNIFCLKHSLQDDRVEV
jgi:hypothetical protein